MIEWFCGLFIKFKAICSFESTSFHLQIIEVSFDEHELQQIIYEQSWSFKGARISIVNDYQLERSEKEKF